MAFIQFRHRHSGATASDYGMPKRNEFLRHRPTGTARNTVMTTSLPMPQPIVPGSLSANQYSWNNPPYSILSPSMNRFDAKLNEHGLLLRRSGIEILQLNVGRKCNQACRHCHVDAAPWRTEMMSEETAQRITDWVRVNRPSTIDITGGAPELSEFFRPLVELGSEIGAKLIDRNPAIIEEPGYEDLPEFLAEHDVEVIASLPCYSAENVNQQRGNGVFDKSIAALKRLNAVGYGERHRLHLVYNPLGPKLPPPQSELESDYKEALESEFGIIFNNLLTITNQPIARFAEDLRSRASG